MDSNYDPGAERLFERTVNNREISWIQHSDLDEEICGDIKKRENE